MGSCINIEHRRCAFVELNAERTHLRSALRAPRDVCITYVSSRYHNSARAKCRVRVCNTTLNKPGVILVQGEGLQKALSRVPAYLLGTADRTLTAPRVKGTRWEFYVDSDHSGERKHGDTKSRAGICPTGRLMPRFPTPLPGPRAAWSPPCSSCQTGRWCRVI